jgi:hypothetical protein
VELDSRKILAVAAPLVVAYLTWSTVSAPTSASSKPTAVATINAALAAKRPEIGELSRNPYAPAAAGGIEGDTLAALSSDDGEQSDKSAAALKLDGTVVAARWRMAIINGERVFEGQPYRGLRVQDVTPSGVTLVAASGETRRLTLDIAPPAPLPKAAAFTRETKDARTLRSETENAPTAARGALAQRPAPTANTTRREPAQRPAPAVKTAPGSPRTEQGGGMLGGNRERR